MDKLMEKVEQLSLKVATNFYSTIKILNTLQAHTERYYDGSHSRFVSEKAELTASELGMSDGDVMQVKMAALLHDIGQIGFSETTLFKTQNEMSAGERRQYLLHPEMGYNLLSMHDNLKKIAVIVYQHHERLDGTGFPRRLKNEEISPAARIIGVVDYFHNSVYKLSRKDATSSGINSFHSTAAYLENTGERYFKALEYLKKKSGVLFDKHVVEVFTHVIDMERREISFKQVIRLPYSSLEPGMILAEDYRTSYGMLIAFKGETLNKDMISSMARFVHSGDLPSRLLVMR